ncbi:alpha/beta fold hydrolase [Flavobacterium ardleyense]|uniref:alpha/beta fold hydrolase n=1 Tax=Flavobacterium ardleyense TaxID=2038737 RepID=UPI00298BCE78|nr:alpha/beta fold hydrolase [Flavobacterium ardleyense]
MLYSKIEGTGKAFLILHGFLGMSDNWKTLGTKWAEAGYEVHLLDLRNHGRSLHSDKFNYDVMAQDVFEYCKEKELSSIFLMGHSMGGKVAMTFAALHPELVEKLIVADIGPKEYKPHHDQILEGLSAVDFTEKPERSDVDEIVSKYVEDLGTRQFLLKSLYWETPGQLAYRFNLPVFLENRDSIGEPLQTDASYSGPTLFLRGSKSNYILDEDFREIRNYFPKATIVTIANAGHWLHAENPDEVYDSVLNFLMQ